MTETHLGHPRSTLVTLMAMLAAALVLGGCSSSRPAWVDDPYAELSADEYFAAVGSGPTSRQAENASAKALAEEIGRVLNHRAVDVSDYLARSEETGNAQAAASAAEILALSGFDKSRRLVDFRIGGTFKEKDGPHYSLATINRARFVSGVETAMRNNKRYADDMSGQAESEPVTLRKLSWYRASLAAAKAHQELALLHQSVGGMSGVLDETLTAPSRSIRSIENELARLKKSVGASIELVEGDDLPNPIEQEIKGALQRLRVPVRTDRTEGHVRILVSWTVDPVFQDRQDVKLMDYTLTVELVEDQSGYSLASWSTTDRTGSTTVRDATAQAAREARQELGEGVDSFFQKALFEQSLTRN